MKFPLRVRLHDHYYCKDLYCHHDQPTHIRSCAERKDSLNIEARPFRCSSQTQSHRAVVAWQTDYDRARSLSSFSTFLLSCSGIAIFPHKIEKHSKHTPPSFRSRRRGHTVFALDLCPILMLVNNDGDRPNFKLLLIPLCITAARRESHEPMTNQTQKSIRKGSISEEERDQPKE